MTPSEVIKYAEKHGAQMIDCKFSDFPGVWQHITYPIWRLNEEAFEDGFGFDGSSIRGWKAIDASDMLMLPDPSTAMMDPFLQIPTLSLICDVVDPTTREPYGRDPRYIAKKAENYLKSTGIADTAYFGPEAEFFIFDSIQYSEEPNHSFFNIDSDEAGWNNRRSETGGNKGFKPPTKGGYCVAGPTDQMADLRTQMVMTMQAVGIVIETHHHEVASAGQAEIDMKYETLVKMADQILWYKHIVKNVARMHGKTATFMPKPLFGDNGSGMHTHQSLWLGGEPLFYDETGYAGLSDMARWYIGGLLHHSPSLLAFTNPTVNSYHRLVPGYEAPVNLVYSARNRSACIRIPVTGSNPKAKRIEFRVPDPSSNPYLAFSAMLMAGLDGVRNKIEPPAPIDKDLYELPPEEAKDIPQVPASLEAVINRLEEDHDYLLEGGVFTPDLIETWIDLKRTNEIDPLRLRPHPYEFALYFDN